MLPHGSVENRWPACVHAWTMTARVNRHRYDDLQAKAQRTYNNITELLVSCTTTSQVGDLPFGCYETGPRDAVQAAVRMLKEGSMDAVKLEGALSVLKTYPHPFTVSSLFIAVFAPLWAMPSNSKYGNCCLRQNRTDVYSGNSTNLKMSHLCHEKYQYLRYQRCHQIGGRVVHVFRREYSQRMLKLVAGGSPARVEAARAIVEAGVAVMGHVGLTPQSVSAIGGFRPQAQVRCIFNASITLYDLCKLPKVITLHGSLVSECTRSCTTVGPDCNAMHMFEQCYQFKRREASHEAALSLQHAFF